MALSAPLLKRKRQLQAKVETTKGTLVTADSDLLVWDLEFNPADNWIQRRYSGKVLGHSSPGVIEGTYAGTAKFKTELRGSGSSGLHAGLAVLLQACGVLKTAEVYTPTSLVASQSCISLARYEDGKKKQLAGCMGNVTIRPENNKLICEWDFAGVWQAPTDEALPTPTYGATKPIPWGHASNAFTMAGESIKISDFQFSTGNTLTPRYQNGRVLHYLVTDRDPTLTIDPESDLVAGYDLYGAWLAGTEVAISLAATDGTDTITLAGTKFQYREIAEGDREGIAIDNVTGQFNFNSAGDDEYSVTAT